MIYHKNVFFFQSKSFFFLIYLEMGSVSPLKCHIMKRNTTRLHKGRATKSFVTGLMWWLTCVSGRMSVWSHVAPHMCLSIPAPFPHGQPLWPPRSHQPSTHFYPGQPPFEAWVINVPSDTPSGHRGSPGGHSCTHISHTHTHTHTHTILNAHSHAYTHRRSIKQR